MLETRENDPLTEKIIGFAIEVHRQLGPGLLESAYEECLCFELKQDGLVVARQVPLPIVYFNTPVLKDGVRRLVL
jgi:GxxExxY protein